MPAPMTQSAIAIHAANGDRSIADVTSHSQHAALAPANERYAGSTHALLHARIVFSDV